MKTSVPPPIMFDPQRRAAGGELRAAIKSLIASLERHEADLVLRRRARRDADRNSFHLAIEVIACNLAALPLLATDRPLAVPRSSGVMWAKGRYRNPVYGQHFLDALDLMAHPKVGLIDEVGRGYRFTADNKQPSVVKPTASFAAHIPPSLIRWEAFGRVEEPEVLILKGTKSDNTGIADAIDYPETRETRRLRKEVERINGWLREAPIRIASDEGPIGVDDDEGQPIDPTRRSVRRIFNNGSWQQGGRLFGGFWETMRRADRFRLLRICTAQNPEGEPVAKRYAMAARHVRLFAEGRSCVTHWPSFVTSMRRSHICSAQGSGIASCSSKAASSSRRFMIATREESPRCPFMTSVLVAASEAEAARSVMEDAFERATGEISRQAESRLWSATTMS